MYDIPPTIVCSVVEAANTQQSRDIMTSTWIHSMKAGHGNILLVHVHVGTCTCLNHVHVVGLPASDSHVWLADGIELDGVSAGLDVRPRLDAAQAARYHVHLVPCARETHQSRHSSAIVVAFIYMHMHTYNTCSNHMSTIAHVWCRSIGSAEMWRKNQIK